MIAKKIVPGLPAPYRVLVACNKEGAVGRRLADDLDPREFKIVVARPGVELLHLVRHLRPEAAVLDLALGREVVSLVIAILKEVVPSVRIIAVSENPSLDDGAIVEQGLFYYLTGEAGDKLSELLRAAARKTG